MRLETSPGQDRLVFYGLSGLIGALTVLAFFGALRIFEGWDLVKASALLFMSFGLAVAAFIKARRTSLAPRVMLTADAHGVAILGQAPTPWSEVQAVIHRSQNAGYGPKDMIGLRRRFTPNGTGATWAERLVRNALADRSFAPSTVGALPVDVLTGLDAEMAKAGYRRGTQKYKERGAYRTWIWPLEPLEGTRDET